MSPKWVLIAMSSAWPGIQWCDAAQLEDQVRPASAQLTDEVLVRGARLRELRAATVAAEERFYARYNELNKVDDYDIECAMNVHTGQRIPQRRCLTRLQLDARARNGIEVLEMRQQQAEGSGQTGRPPNTNPEGIWLSRYDEYKSNMLYLLKVHPELRRLARDSEAAQKRYDTEYRRRLKGRLILVE
jgi:hypothetical protein